MKKLMRVWLIAVAVIMGSSIESKACEVPTYDSVARLYVATFNRAPDSAGIEYWMNESFGGHPCLEQIASSFFDQPETQEKYPEGVTVETFVDNVYLNLFNHHADEGGLGYWSEQIKAGAFSRSEFILAVINGALAETGSPDDAQILTNKATVGIAFAKAGLENVTQAKEIMQNVTGVKESVDSALEMIDLFKNGSTNGNGTVDFDPFTTCIANADYDNDLFNMHLHYTIEVGADGNLKSVKEVNPYISTIETCSLALADGPFTIHEFYKTILIDAVVENETVKGSVTYNSVDRTIHYEGFTSSEGDISCTEHYRTVPFPMLIENDEMTLELLGAWEHASSQNDPLLESTDCPADMYDTDVGVEPELSDTELQGVIEMKVAVIDENGNESKVYFKTMSNQTK